MQYQQVSQKHAFEDEFYSCLCLYIHALHMLFIKVYILLQDPEMKIRFTCDMYKKQYKVL